MKILQVIADGTPGGGSTHLLQILRRIKDNIHFGVLTQHGSFLSREVHELGIDCYDMDLFSTTGSISALRRSQAVIQDFQPDIIHVHGGRAAYFVSLLRSRGRKIYTVHGYHFLYRSPIRKNIQVLIERFASARVDLMVFVSEFDHNTAREMRLLLPNLPTSVIHNGVPLLNTGSKAEITSLKIGFVGRMEHPKDPHLYLEVIRRLPDLKSIMIGDGSMADGVRRYIYKSQLDHLEFLGGMTHKEVLDYLPTIGVLVITSRWEGLPLIALEAMHAGVPIVATDVGGLSEIIESGKSGILIDSRDPEVIAQQVRNVLEDESLRRRLILEGRKRVKEHFSEERMLNEIKAVYESVLANHAK